MYKRIKCILFVFMLVVCVIAKAQKYRMEVGCDAGTSFYMGDANNCKIFDNPGFSGGLFLRYNLSGRFALVSDFEYSAVKGDTYGKRASFAYGRDFSFKQNIYSADLKMEFNFFEYGMPSYVRGVSKFCPYLTTGFGFCKYNSDYSPMIPIGFGVKYKIFKRVNIGAEWVFNMLLKDNLDYKSYSGLFQLDDPCLTESTSIKNKDWYSVFSISVSYDIRNTACKCFR